MAIDVVKVVKVVATLASIGASLAGGWANNKVLEKLVDEAVEKRLKN